jgi:hypothetical protein
MTTFGSTSVPNNLWYQNTGTDNQVGTLATAPQDGVIDTLSVYGAGQGATPCDTALCVWDASGNLLARSATFTTSGGGTGVGNQAWQTAALLVPLSVSAGVSYYLGFWRDPARTFDYSTDTTGGGTTHKQGADISAPGKLGTSVDTAEHLGAYATYAQGGAHVVQGDASEPLRFAFVTQGDTSKPERQILVKNADGTYHAAT